MPRAVTGRAVSASIHNRLREALLQGEPLSYAQLAQRAGCTVRSVRNYLTKSQEIFGFKVERSRPQQGHAVLVRAMPSIGHPKSSPNVTSILAATLRDRLFANGHASRDYSDRLSPLAVCFRGIPIYFAEHENLLSAWLNACCHEPRHAVRIRLLSPCDPTELILWPLGALLHNLEGLLLGGLPLEANSPRDVRIINLDSVSLEPGSIHLLDRSETGDPSLDLNSLELAQVLDLPFSLQPASQSLQSPVDVHVRFRPPWAERMRTRIWHHAQSSVLRTDGSLEIRFGPVELGPAASWISSFGEAVRVLGDKKLRKAVKRRAFVP